MVTSCPALSRGGARVPPVKKSSPMTRTRMSAGQCNAGSVVVLEAEMCDQVFSAHPAQRILQLHKLNEDIMLGVQAFSSHGRLEVEREPFLDASHPGALCEIEKQHQIQHNRCGQNRI